MGGSKRKRFVAALFGVREPDPAFSGRKLGFGQGRISAACQRGGTDPKRRQAAALRRRSAPAIGSLRDALQGENLFLYTRWKVHKQKIAYVMEVILSALVDNPHQIILGRLRIGKNPINLAR